MAKLRVVYTVQHVEYIEGTNEEINALDYDSLVFNLDFDNAKHRDFDDFVNITKDGKNFHF